MITLNKINHSQIASIVLRRSFVTGLFKPEPPHGPHTVFSCCTSNFPPFFPPMWWVCWRSQVKCVSQLHVLIVLSWNWPKKELQWKSPLLSGNFYFYFFYFPICLPMEYKFQGHWLKTNGLLACLLPSFAWVPLFWLYSDPKWDSNVEGPTQCPLQLMASTI